MDVIHSSSVRAYVISSSQRSPPEVRRSRSAWFQPDGELLGVAQKSRSPDVASAVGSGSPLPKAAWRVDLRAGPTVVKSLTVHIQ